ncbi:ATP-binding cassette domain-containing protein [Streptococcus sp. 10F2]
MIELNHVTKQYGQRILFNDINFSLKSGMIYVLKGRSGSGKTTLLNMMAKLEPVDSGEILFKGKNLKDYRDVLFFRNELGYLFQQFGLIDNETVESNLSLGLVGQKLNRKEEYQRKVEALAQVGLSSKILKSFIYELSGGEAQRIALAKVVLKNPPLIFADEPTASLDPENADQVMELLISLKSPERLIVIASHNPEIWDMADEVIAIDKLG